MQQTGKLKIIETFASPVLAPAYGQQLLHSARKKIGGRYTLFTKAGCKKVTGKQTAQFSLQFQQV